MSDLFQRPLKEAGSKAIEEAITKAITELVGEEYQADIKAIDFNPSNTAWMSDEIEIKLSLSKVKGWYAQTSEFVERAGEAEGEPKPTIATCKLCDANGFRFVKDSRYPNGAMKKCSHDPEVEAQIPSGDK
jgi:hypothetical protein